MASSPHVQVFSPTNKEECRAAVRTLQKEQLIALDSEGIQLGKDGPLTLLQIGTLDGNVYLFDVMLNEHDQDKNFFKDTGLNIVLKSTKIVKVIQSCSGDSAALFYQFGIRLENVFDTQVAHLVIQENKGQKLASRVKLAEICKTYSENASVYEGKEYVQMEWVKNVGNFWAKRPMTKDMIDYASGDVTALIPEVYETQKRYLEQNNLLDIFAKEVQEEIDYEIDPTGKERRKQKHAEVRLAILQDMAEKYRERIDFTSITNEDEIKALDNANFTEMSHLPDVIQALKRGSMAALLKSLEERLSDPTTFNSERSLMFKLNEIERHGSGALGKEASRIKEQVVRVITDDVQKKYNPDTPLENISAPEIQFLRGLKPLLDGEPAYQPTILALHWKIAEADVNDVAQKLNAIPNYEVTMIPKLRFFTSNPRVPARIKRISQALLDKYESVIVDRIQQKYTRDTRVGELLDSDKIFLERLKISSKSYHPVVVSLHWKVTYEKLCKDFDDCRAGRLSVNDGFRGKLNFFAKNSSVPPDVKNKASDFLGLLPKNTRNTRGGGRRY